MDPFVYLTPNDFTVDIAEQIVKNSKHEAINREVGLISGRLEWAARMADDTERLLSYTTR
jgi:hypothetical protein